MSHMLQEIPVVFQWLALTSGASMRHERDMDDDPIESNPNEGIWYAAVMAMAIDEDLIPLSRLLANRELPLPWSVRKMLANHMNPPAASPKKDRIMFVRTKASRAKNRTVGRRIQHGFEVLKLQAKGASTSPQ